MAITSRLQRRKYRVRKSLRKNAKGRIRLSIYRSNQHIYAQLIDDEKQVTLAQASTNDNEISSKAKCGSNIDAAKLVGAAIAKKAKTAKVSSDNIVFDRGGYVYHGRVKALAEAAREEGLEF
jgi:large subunit ribosomal protein L18